jgi:polyphosphate kinase
MGDRAQYVKITGDGKNALDFHIAFYIGQIAAKDPHAFFHVISKDKGFQPLVEHLKILNIFCARSEEIHAIPLVRSSKMKTPDQRAAIFVEKLEKPGTTRARTLKTLRNAIATLFQKQVSDADVDAVIAELQNRGFLTIVDSKVVYSASAG